MAGTGGRARWTATADRPATVPASCGASSGAARRPKRRRPGRGWSWSACASSWPRPRRPLAAAAAEAQRLTTELAGGAAHALQQMERAVKKRAAGAEAATEKTGFCRSRAVAGAGELAAAVSRSRRSTGRPRRAACRRPLRRRASACLAHRGARGHPWASAASGRRRQRKPIAVPGGVYGNSEAAGEHLLRTLDVVVLVDGYNVAKLGWPGCRSNSSASAASRPRRTWLVDGAALLHVVFDGASVVGAAAPAAGGWCASASRPKVSSPTMCCAPRSPRSISIVRWWWSPTTRRSSPTSAPPAPTSLSSDAFLAVARR
jgi:hypothetical protein